MRMERIAGVTACELQAEYWSVSARSGYKVTDFFQRIAALAFERAMQQELRALNNRSQAQTAQITEKSQGFGKFHKGSTKYIDINLITLS